LRQFFYKKILDTQTKPDDWINRNLRMTHAQESFFPVREKEANAQKKKNGSLRSKKKTNNAL